MRIVIALGGNALLRRGEPLTAENQRQNVRIACEQIAKIYPNNELVLLMVMVLKLVYLLYRVRLTRMCRLIH